MKIFPQLKEEKYSVDLISELSQYIEFLADLESSNLKDKTSTNIFKVGPIRKL